MPITRIGTSFANSDITSKSLDADQPVQRADAELADLRLERGTRRGVNTRDSKARWMSWIGGSSIISVPGGISMPALMTSRIGPRAEENVLQSVSAASMSAWRLRV